jgi:hypothetical protein
MTKATVTYAAPKGDSKVVEHAGYTFFDGHPVEVDVDDLRLGKLKNNPLFKVSDGHPPKGSDSHPPPKGKDK